LSWWREGKKAFVAKQSQTAKQSITRVVLPFLNTTGERGEGAHKRSEGGGKTLRKNLHFTNKRSAAGGKIFYRFLSESAKWMEGKAREGIRLVFFKQKKRQTMG
jgi:hypothetical protein